MQVKANHVWTTSSMVLAVTWLFPHCFCLTWHFHSSPLPPHEGSSFSLNPGLVLCRGHRAFGVSSSIANPHGESFQPGTDLAFGGLVPCPCLVLPSVLLISKQVFGPFRSPRPSPLPPQPSSKKKNIYLINSLGLTSTN